MRPVLFLAVLGWMLAACGGGSKKQSDAGETGDAGSDAAVSAACADSAVAAACAQAAANETSCCGGTQPASTGAQLCQSFVSASQDPATGCGTLSGMSCDALHASALQSDACCCPAGQLCDPSASNACAPACNTSADCPASRPACAPTFGTIGGSVVITGPYICVPNDGNLGHGCNGIQTCDGTGASNDLCAQDSRGNHFCTTPCTGDATCGNSGTACCNVAKGSASACGFCAAP